MRDDMPVEGEIEEAGETEGAGVTEDGELDDAPRRKTLAESAEAYAKNPLCVGCTMFCTFRRPYREGGKGKVIISCGEPRRVKRHLEKQKQN